MGPAAIATRWRHNLPHLKTISNTNALISFSRWLSEPTATQAFDAENILQPSASTEPMFGLSPRKGRPRADVEGEDLISESSQVGPSKMDTSVSLEPSNDAEQENYFSKAWASQKNLDNRPWPRLVEQPNRQREFQLSYAPQTQDHNRFWQYASDMPPFVQEKFIIASFNILASTFARQYKVLLYNHVPDHFLDWKRRKPKIIFELGLCSPDIICLQEVDRFRDLQEELAFKGYVGLYKARTGTAPDGCAIFWRKDRFKLLEEESLEFSAMGLKDNIAQFCVLESLVSGPVNNGGATGSRMEGSRKNHCLIVGNVHLLYNPKRGDIKLGQCRTFLEKAYMLSSSWPGAPVVIGGDFNSTPSSAIYDFLATSELEVSGLDRSYLSGQFTKVANSAFTDSKAGESRKSEPETYASSQLKKLLLEAKRSTEISKGALDSKVSCEQIPDSRGTTSEVLDTNHLEMNSHDSAAGNEIQWDSEELKTATGDPECTFVQHKLNLCSVYTEVQGQAGTRDSKGEPLITKYNKLFRGTVDYIWRSDGLKPVRVLETIPAEGMLMHKGLPAKVWGSDHLAIACELSFTPNQTGLGSNKVEPKT